MSIAKQVVRIGPFKDVIASGVRVGDAITLSGQVSLNNDGEVVGEGDLGAQIRQVYANVEEVLAEFGASIENIVDEMWLVTDMQSAMSDIGRLMAIRDEIFGGTYNATQTMVQVAALVMPELLIEIKCVARL